VNEDKWKKQAEDIVGDICASMLPDETCNTLIGSIATALATAAQVQPGHVRTEDGVEVPLKSPIEMENGSGTQWIVEIPESQK